MITVIGKWRDIRHYIGRDGYNVFPGSPNATKDDLYEWLVEAHARKDMFLLVSDDLSDVYKEEVEILIELMSRNVPGHKRDDEARARCPEKAHKRTERAHG